LKNFCFEPEAMNELPKTPNWYLFGKAGIR